MQHNIFNLVINSYINEMLQFVIKLYNGHFIFHII